MTVAHDNRPAAPPAGKKWSWDEAAPWLAAMVALLGRLPALGAYWNQDDWGLLAGASGLAGAPTSALRWLSRVAYWDLMWPLAGLDPHPYAWTRLALHAAAAAGTVKLGRRLGYSGLQAAVAGLIMAATPLAFTALYWAAGVQDLLAVAAAVWALVLWCDRGPWRTGGAIALAVVAVASKETLVGLPLVMAAAAWLGPAARRGPRGLAPLAVTAAAAAVAAGLALRGFDTSDLQPYELGGPLDMLRHLLVYGWWLLQPGPAYTTDPIVAMAAAGGALWLGWFAWGWSRRRQGRPADLLVWLAALITVAPLLPLLRHLAPDLAYPVEPFGALALGGLVPRRLDRRPWLLGVAAVLAGAWGFLGMEGRLALRDPDGLPADPVVRRTAVSWQVARQLPRLPIGEAGLVIVQPPLARETARMALALGEDWVTGSDAYHSLGGALGPRLLLGPDVPVRWTNGLRFVPEGSFVLFDAGGELKPWGFLDQALLYQALTDVGLGHFERARLHLLRAGLLGGDTLTLIFDPGLLPVGLDQVLANKVAFIDHLAAGLQQGRSPFEVGGVQTNFFRLLSACTGIDEATLRADGGPSGKATP
ncbi:MAG: hypothetical protein R3D98_11875 [Candidatus Krumholzibacteriia bacterium]